MLKNTTVTLYLTYFYCGCNKLGVHNHIDKLNDGKHYKINVKCIEPKMESRFQNAFEIAFPHGFSYSHGQLSPFQGRAFLNYGQVEKSMGSFGAPCTYHGKRIGDCRISTINHDLSTGRSLNN